MTHIAFVGEIGQEDRTSADEAENFPFRRVGAPTTAWERGWI
jgi:hypothetical protein